jgi:predicted ATPase
LLDALPDDSPFLQLDPPQRRQHTLDGLKRILLRESQVQPLVLVFEDLHWIDSETQTLLDSLVESLPTVQLLLLVNYRPEYTHNWGSKTYYAQLRLDPLPPESADEFLDVLLGDDVSLELLKKLLIERTEGNPFFLEESVRTLVETQELVGEAGAYRLAQARPTIQVPPTVQAVLAARIDRLPPDEKLLLQTAAVIGTEVTFPLLQAIAELVDETLYRGLTTLQSAEFLYEASLFPERVYTFKHALTHEVAYGSLLQERRRVLHGRIVEALEALYADRLTEQTERLAYHAWRSEQSDKALSYCRQAGEKAMARSAHREAVESFEQALSALSHLPETHDTVEQAFDLRLAMRSVLYPAGDFGRLLAYLREAGALAEALDDPRRLGQVSVFLSHFFRLMRAHDQAIAAGQRALELASATGDVMLQALAHYYLGTDYYEQGDYRRARDCLRRAVASLDRAQRHGLFGQFTLPAVGFRVYLVGCHIELGTFAEGRSLGEEGLQIAETAAHPMSRMGASRWLGLLALRQGDIQRALSLLERAMRICQEADFTAFFPFVAAPLGEAYTLGRRVADAVLLLTQAMDQSMETNMVGFQALCHLPLGEAHLAAGRLEEVHALAERALTLAREHGERGNQAYALRLLGDVAIRRDSPEIEQAKTRYQQSLALANELGMRPLQAHCHRSLGKLYSQTGQREQARAEFSTAIAMYREMEMTFWLPEMEAALAQVEGQ